MVGEKEGMSAEAAVAEQKVGQRGDSNTANEEDGHHLLDEAAAEAADGESGNGRVGMWNADRCIFSLRLVIRNNMKKD